MATYISILRGINVTGRRVKMDVLKQMYIDLKFDKVTSYIQSGNVIFESKKTSVALLELKIGTAITTTFKFDSPVIVKEIDSLQKIIKANPFLKDKTKDVSFLHVTFLSASPDAALFDKLLMIDYKDDAIALVEDAIYLYCPNGYSNSKLTNSFLENKLKVSATTRNWNTTLELLKMAEGL
jgi:uncharacterized protein (DUF1697 family)